MEGRNEMNICWAAAVSWALVWHVPPEVGQMRPVPWSQFARMCYSQQADCSGAATIANEAFRVAGVSNERYRAECVEQPARDK